MFVVNRTALARDPVICTTEFLFVFDIGTVESINTWTVSYLYISILVFIYNINNFPTLQCSVLYHTCQVSVTIFLVPAGYDTTKWPAAIL